MMTIVNRNSLPVGVLAALMAIAPGAHAASAGNGSTEGKSFDQEQIDSFASAQTELEQIQQEYTSKTQEGGQDQAAQMQREMQQEMVSAVEDTGLEVEEFNQIAKASRNDEELAERIQNAGE